MGPVVRSPNPSRFRSRHICLRAWGGGCGLFTLGQFWSLRKFFPHANRGVGGKSQSLEILLRDFQQLRLTRTIRRLTGIFETAAGLRATMCCVCVTPESVYQRCFLCFAPNRLSQAVLPSEPFLGMLTVIAAHCANQAAAGCFGAKVTFNIKNAA